MTVLRRLPGRIGRTAHRLYATTLGYFWAPCPLCGQHFGGHQWRDIDGKVSSIPDPDKGPYAGLAICPACTQAGRGRSSRDSHPMQPAESG